MYSNQDHHSRPSLLLDKRFQLFEQPRRYFLWRHPIICGTTFLTSDYFSRAPPTHRVYTDLCPQRLRFHPLPSTRISSTPPCAVRRGIDTIPSNMVDLQVHDLLRTPLDQQEQAHASSTTRRLAFRLPAGPCTIGACEAPPPPKDEPRPVFGLLGRYGAASSIYSLSVVMHIGPTPRGWVLRHCLEAIFPILYVDGGNINDGFTHRGIWEQGSVRRQHDCQR